MYLYLFSCDDWPVYISSVYKVSMCDRIFLVFISVSQILCVCTYLAVMIGLYISPLFIKSPCVIEAENIPNKPKIFAQKGAPVVRLLV